MKKKTGGDIDQKTNEQESGADCKVIMALPPLVSPPVPSSSLSSCPLPTLSSEITTILTPPLEGTLLVITVGNTLRGDDGVGPCIARLACQPQAGIHLINSGEHPENCLEVAVRIRPARIVILDAADFGGNSGEVRLLSSEDLHQTLLSTHNFPLAIIGRLLSDDTGAEVYFMGIQAVDVALGSAISPSVLATAEVVAGLLCGSGVRGFEAEIL